MIPRPVSHAAVANPDTVATLRHLDCRQYDRCLVVACDANWQGFTCRLCHAYDPKSLAELRVEAEGIASALAKRRA